MAKGSIEKRGENKWRLTVDLGLKGDGTRDRPRKTITVEDKALLKTKKKLQEYLENELAKFRLEIESGEYIKPEKMLFKDFVEKEWKPKYASKEDNLSALSYKTYCRHIKNHIMPVFGNKDLGDIKTMHIVTFVDDLGKPGARKDGKGDTLEPGTIQYIYRVLKNILSRADEWDLIKENPMSKVKKPKVKQTEFEFYDEDEARDVIGALYQEVRKWRLFILGAMIGGNRRGELIALEWPEVDFEKGAVAVEKSISLTENSQAIEKGPKNASSKRWIDMPNWYMDELRVHKREWDLQRKKAILAGEWLGGERQYVFHGGYGKPYYHSYPSEWWIKFVKRHALKRVRFHDLRHSSATLLIEAGASMKAIQKRLGHAKHQTTADIYAHVTKKVSRDTAEKFDKFAPRPISVPNLSPR
ncbi:tyrosine-type recombinase/integrase [Paenibacillus daejeonensis]|uniref:tyrosine-type recombinase/integrase n=1 Tax=Paenibacillus daejeonensis TaxID=135193 RepID=UPI00036AEFD5|nr:tyrosine-type recombinase/integrase [Paenibacillus daejeonensis]